MKKHIGALFLLMALLLIPLTVSANSNDLKSPDGFKKYAFIENSIYYINDNFLDKPNGLYKVSHNMKSTKLLARGDFSNVIAYKNTLLVYNMKKDFVEQYGVDGTLIKQYKELDTYHYILQGDLLYYYDYEDEAFKIYNFKTDKTTFLRKLNNSFLKEFTVHNGWFYYVHEFQYNESGTKSEQFLSKFKISDPTKLQKVIKNVYNIDSVVIRDGYIFAVIHKNKTFTNYNRYIYRMNYNGEKQVRVAKIDTNTSFAVSKKQIYFVKNAVDFNLKFYKMNYNGKNVQYLGKIPGSPSSITSHNGYMYFDLQNGAKFLLHRAKAY